MKNTREKTIRSLCIISLSMEFENRCLTLKYLKMPINLFAYLSICSSCMSTILHYFVNKKIFLNIFMFKWAVYCDECLLVYKSLQQFSGIWTEFKSHNNRRIKLHKIFWFFSKFNTKPSQYSFAFLYTKHF